MVPDSEAGQKDSVTIVGSGAFGTTMAKVLVEKGLSVKLWVMEEQLALQLNTLHINSKYLPGIPLPDSIRASSDMAQAASGATAVVFAVPSQYVRETARKFRAAVGDNFFKGLPVINLAKGIEHDAAHGTFRRMSQVLHEELDVEGGPHIIALSGPNLAEEIARGIPTGTVVAGARGEVLDRVARMLHTKYFKVYPHDDIIGVELCGTFKNVCAIAAGMTDGLGFGDNTRASIITLGLHEMMRFGASMGAKKSTFFGIAGVGDLVATSCSKHSRNRLVGELLAQCLPMDQIYVKLNGRVAEGILASKVLHETLKNTKVMGGENNLILSEMIYRIIWEKKDLAEAIKDLINLIN